MLTINAADHLLMCNFHKPGDQKRMVAVLNDDACEAWLMAPPGQSMAFMRQCPPEQLVAATDDVPT
jgi:putative SOS response-associated peptidase YedK